jgi:hypothetical protein
MNITRIIKVLEVIPGFAMPEIAHRLNKSPQAFNQKINEYAWL